MNTDNALFNIVLIIAVIELLVIIILIFFRSSRLIQDGDIVLYSNPDSKSCCEKNLVTSVIFSNQESATAIIRFEKTTMVVPINRLQVLNLDMTYPIQVPTRPQADYVIPRGVEKESDLGVVYEDEVLPPGAHISSCCNNAHYSAIPISWIFSGVIVNDERRLQTIIKY